jgi:hypothetical protein
MKSQDSFEPSELHVVAVVHNPLRFRSRHGLFREFAQRCEQAEVTLHVIEAAFGDRYHDHVEDGVDRHVLLVQNQELWIKESMINVGFSRLPADWKYAAWIDGDVSFARLDWAQETIHQLQHFRVVQMFQTAVDLGPDGEVMQVFNGFGYSMIAGLPDPLEGTPNGGYYHHASTQSVPGGATRKFWHPGFAWAIRRDTFDAMGGLIDWAILGSADHMMAQAWIGKVHRAVAPGVHPNYARHAQIFQERCEEAVRRDVGYVPGTLLHWWHGKKRDRRYVDRWEILKRHAYDPERDIRRDHQGLVQLTRPGERMRDDLRGYFRARNEDSIDREP